MALPPGLSINNSTLKDTYLGLPRKMHLLLAHDMAHFIREAGKGAFLYCYDIAHAYGQLQLDSTGLLSISW